MKVKGRASRTDWPTWSKLVDQVLKRKVKGRASRTDWPTWSRLVDKVLKRRQGPGVRI